MSSKEGANENPIAINMQGPRIQYGTWQAIPGAMTARRAVDHGWWRIVPRRWRPRESYIPPAAWRRTVVELIPRGGRRVTFRISIETTYTQPKDWKETR